MDLKICGVVNKLNIKYMCYDNVYLDILVWYRNFCVMCVGGNIVYFVWNNYGLYYLSVW